MLQPDAAPLRPYLGVLGGMGPLAGAAFVMRLVALTPVNEDQAHIPTFLRNDPRIPDRSRACTEGEESPLPALLAGLRALESAGSGLIAIPCNTAHLWYEDLAAAASVPILHIVECVADELDRKGIRSGRIGILGTEATLALGLYQRSLSRRGHDCIVPDAQELERHCMAAIHAVKANRPDLAFVPAMAAVAELRRRGADAIVLGCTELPLAIPHDRRREAGIPIADSIDALARAAIRNRPDRLAPYSHWRDPMTKARTRADDADPGLLAKQRA